MVKNLNIKKFHIKRMLILSALFLAGCATDKNIQLNESFWQQKHKIAIAAIKPEKPGVTKAGCQGLLDYAINSAMTNTLDTHLSKINLTWYYSLPKDFARKLKKNHIPAIIVDDQFNNDEMNITSLAARNKVNEIFIIKLRAVGVIRLYYGFIPISEPEAYSVLQGELINTSTNTVIWRHLAEVRLPITGEWDQPPYYPNITCAVQHAILTSRQELLDNFFSGR